MAGRYIYVPCMQCTQEDLEIGIIPRSITYKLFNPNNDKTHIEFICEKGHKNVVLIQELLFEALLNIAVEDYISKYYRESVFNFASAQERCFEFIIELLCIEKGLSKEIYNELWRFLPYSERQFGAFCALYFLKFNKKPFKIQNKMTEIRNDVVHKGETPTKEQTKEYGNYVIENIYNMMKDIIENVEPRLLFEFQCEKLQEIQKGRGKISADSYVTSVNNRILSWRSASAEDLERERKLSEYSSNHGKEYADMAVKANQLHKTLDVNDKGELILIEPKDPFIKDPKAEYIGNKNIEEYISFILPLKHHYEMVEKGFVEGSKVINCTDLA